MKKSTTFAVPFEKTVFEKKQQMGYVLSTKKLQQLKCSIREREFFLCHVNEKIRKEKVSSELKEIY